MTKPWCKTAPVRLVSAYTNREVGVGRQFLERLLQDQRMNNTWSQLAKHIKNDDQWISFWNAIVFAKRKSNKDLKVRNQRAEVRENFRAIAKQIAKLVRDIQNGPMDMLVFEFFPQEVLDALHVGNLHSLDLKQRSEAAHGLLPCWPTSSELLMGLEKWASILADDAMNKPRADERNSGYVKARIFIWYLGQDFREIFGKPMLGSLAILTSVIFKVDEDFNRSFVQDVLRGV